MVQAYVKRPTSPLHFEPLESNDEDVLWPGSDDEADEEEREKKRLRIEILGRQYLEGRPLFIQTAMLRGPFDRGWINPWAKESKRPAAKTHRISNASKAPYRKAFTSLDPAPPASASKRSSLIQSNAVGSRGGSTAEEAWEESLAKRRKRDQTSRPTEPVLDRSRYIPEEILRDDGPSDWLKRDRIHTHSRTDSGRGSPTPTPSRPRVRTIETMPSLQQPPNLGEVSRDRSDHVEFRPPSHRDTSEAMTINNQITESSRKIIQPPESFRKQAEHPPMVDFTDDAKYTIQKTNEPAKDPVQALKSKEKLFKSMQPPTPPALAEAKPNTENRTPSRLAPYVSDIITVDAASSAGFKSSPRAPKPSPRTSSSSTEMSKFEYRYSKKQPSPLNSKNVPDYPNGTRPKDLRARSISTSSSGSSEYAEALEAAKAKAASGSMISSHTPSPIHQRPETKSIKRNTQEMRRLTFTTSGEPQVASSCRPLGSGSNSSATGQSVAELPDIVSSKGSHKKKAKKKDSTKSSDQILTDGTLSHEPSVLPEAQMVSDPPAKLAQGPSTDLMETDKQSPKFVSLDEEDSYFDLSTQAAVLKAQQAFKDEILSPIKVSPQTSRHGMLSPTKFKLDRAQITPSGHPSRTTHGSTIKLEPKDGEEAMSTQAIADAISPFAVTTVKKRPPLSEKRTSFAPSPTLNRQPHPLHPPSSPEPSPTFHKPLSLSTTPSTSQPKPTPPIPTPASHPKPTSKPPSSSLTSFCKLPNGTMTDASDLQDGQQQPRPDFDASLPPLDPFSTPFGTASGKGEEQQMGSSYDLDAAIEETGSFLGNWDVEAEARKEGKEVRRREEVRRGILARARGSG